MPLDMVFCQDENDEEQTGRSVRALVVISQAFAPMKNEIRKSFAGQTETQVIVDRRNAERRSQEVQVDRDRRQEARRKPKASILHVILKP
ncbi:MAG: hypothetical protein K9K79_02465 [Desulfohalobiaceae bacterium]|nr:hypothetical protein [Desulfohalobiaceae bacterium]